MLTTFVQQFFRENVLLKLNSVTFLLCFLIYVTNFAEKQYPDIYQSHDIWHAAKNMGEKILNVSDHSLKVRYGSIYNKQILLFVIKIIGITLRYKYMLDLISIFQVAQKKGNSILLGWCKDIVNHFWFSCREANTYEELVVSYIPIIFLRRISLCQKLPFHFE